MSAAARSILVYSIYTFGRGATLLLAPNIPLPLFGLPQVQEVWVRVAGMTVIFPVDLLLHRRAVRAAADLRDERGDPIRRAGLLRGLRGGGVCALESDPVHAVRRALRDLDPGRELERGI